MSISTSEFLAGDANLDGKVNISDAIAVASFVGEPDKNPIEAQGIINGDVLSMINKKIPF